MHLWIKVYKLKFEFNLSLQLSFSKTEFLTISNILLSGTEHDF